MSERTGGRIALALVVMCAALAYLGTGAMDDLDASPRNDQRRFNFTESRLTVVVDGDGELRLERERGHELVVTRELAGAAAKQDNANWALDRDTLRLSAHCPGIVINCRGAYVVKVPSGIDVSVMSPGSVTVVGLLCALRISTETGDVRLERTSGTLRLRSDSGRIHLVDARSADVDARTRRAPLSLAFARPPVHVVAISDAGDVNVKVPSAPAQYRVDGTAGNAAGVRVDIADVPSATRSIVARTDKGVARVREAEK
ncbi:DUF4097 domain-containing protein [Streptomyces hygroscopicus]|uniref:DUF4097 domain-containing protein n=1 Tax=Streptomyces hygroscopicus TaxID=1912 RepID=UPI0011813F51|nr:DUF4097 domain-containing protein [Streptomyces hygroscopicus]